MQLINVAKVIAFAYKSTLPIDGLQKIVTDFENSSSTEEEMKNILHQYNWKEAVGTKGMPKFPKVGSKKK